MQIGDLVMLSEYGIARDYNRRITMEDPYQLGLIIKVKHNSAYEFNVQWTKTKNHQWHVKQCHMRRELKFAHQVNAFRST